MENEVYDYSLYDRIWQRVSPELNPYPEVRGNETMCRAEVSPELSAMLGEWINDELSDRCAYLTYAQRFGGEARRCFRQMAADEGRHAHRLMTIYYLTTGTCYQAAVPTCPASGTAWCALLRQLYHAEICGSERYEKGAVHLPDACLQKLVTAMAADERRHARMLLQLLERSPLA